MFHTDDHFCPYLVDPPYTLPKLTERFRLRPIVTAQEALNLGWKQHFLKFGAHVQKWGHLHHPTTRCKVSSQARIIYVNVWYICRKQNEPPGIRSFNKKFNRWTPRGYRDNQHPHYSRVSSPGGTVTTSTPIIHVWVEGRPVYAHFMSETSTRPKIPGYRTLKKPQFLPTLWVPVWGDAGNLEKQFVSTLNYHPSHLCTWDKRTKLYYAFALFHGLKETTISPFSVFRPTSKLGADLRQSACIHWALRRPS